jgi:hypothetical protein
MSVLLCSIAILFASCAKEQESETALEGGCDALKTIHQVKTLSTESVQIGDPINVIVPEIVGYRIFSWIGPNNFDSQYPGNTVTGYAELKHEGWYYIHVSNPDCEGETDSVYVDVRLKQGTPSCTVAANTTTYSNMFDNTYYYRYKGIDAGTGTLSLTANGTNGDLSIFFHPHWKTVEPEDGIYNTVTNFDQVDGNYNKVIVSTVTQSIYWLAAPNAEVYVSHVNGKLQVRFCGLPMSGSNGTTYNTNASCNISAP